MKPCNCLDRHVTVWSVLMCAFSPFHVNVKASGGSNRDLRARKREEEEEESGFVQLTLGAFCVFMNQIKSVAIVKIKKAFVDWLVDLVQQQYG